MQALAVKDKNDSDFFTEDESYIIENSRMDNAWENDIISSDDFDDHEIIVMDDKPEGLASVSAPSRSSDRFHSVDIDPIENETLILENDDLVPPSAGDQHRRNLDTLADINQDDSPSQDYAALLEELHREELDDILADTELDLLSVSHYHTNDSLDDPYRDDETEIELIEPEPIDIDEFSELEEKVFQQKNIKTTGIDSLGDIADDIQFDSDDEFNLNDDDAGNNLSSPLESTFFDGDDDAPVALSDDELDLIIDDASDDIITIDDDSPSHADFFEDNPADQPVALSDEELQGILEEAGDPSDFSEDGKDHDFFIDDTDEEPIALSDTELILDDAESEEPIALSDTELDSILDDAESEEPIALSDTELILDDAESEEPIALSDTELILDDAESEEPIALSDTELDNIQSFDLLAGEKLAQNIPTQHPDERFIVDEMETDPQEEPVPTDDLPLPHPKDEIALPLAAVGVSAPIVDEEPFEMEPFVLTEDLSRSSLTIGEKDSRQVPEPPVIPTDVPKASPPSPKTPEKTIINEKDIEELSSEEKVPTDTKSEDSKEDIGDLNKEELRNIISYLDQLLGELPDEVIQSFAESEYFLLYQKVMDKLNL